MNLVIVVKVSPRAAKIGIVTRRQYIEKEPATVKDYREALRGLHDNDEVVSINYGD